ncbi:MULTISPECIES: SAM-dependent methyltransferase [unclassified Streptomyces]|uniref:SAM-dependent methyltransferase n=1 Tax=unclassified Streptomyces TaxID=2593676 RepID=UPI002DDAC584|nr:MULTISPECIES: SAM-dependent methyltransferase [unclassified Streptomyces]WSA96539.1 SAM-dependent methyltransferase [Streptomyces sp. NBC_01795]WSB80954.1 SAM-dependent methyltransferase [Streptomyces sp. NBC_01775]WSS10837.1 SAM-dependent methyltransferase [Streptomyces sp. NBC_01186]WSS39534.1 SAM-dependent methyltransferase [Streptomyces sp. NBC_01187]
MTERTERSQIEIDTTVPHSARIWNYLLGGKDHYAVDRAAGDKVCQVFPGMVDITRHSRAFTGRVVRHLGHEAGIRQYLDIGTGLPTVDNTHEIAQRVAPESRIVYVDNDPLVLAHAQALLTSTPQGATSYLHADVRDPDSILSACANTLDLSRPVGLMLMGILGLVGDYDEARAVTVRLLDALPPGSYLALNDGSTTDPDYVEAIRRFNANSGAVPYTPRTPEEIAGFFEGLELLEPGITSCPRWRPEALPFGEPREIAVHGGLARKP